MVQTQPKFKLGFKALADQIPEIVGIPLKDEEHVANGDGLQPTLMPNGATGLLVWRKADNWTAFTDGHRTWINGPFGLQLRLNDQLFAWEMPKPAYTVEDICDQLAVATWNPHPTRKWKQIQLIVVHWDGGPAPIPERYDPVEYYQWEARLHIARNWANPGEKPIYGYGLMYHLKISRDGRRWIVRPDTDEVWAAMGANPIGYMICVDANPQSPPTADQKASLREALDEARRASGLPRSAVWGHGELVQYGNAGNECPGDELRELVREYRE